MKQLLKKKNCIFVYINLICNFCISIDIKIVLLNILFLDNKIHRLISIQKWLISKIKNNYNIVNRAKNIKLFDNYKYTKS